MPNEKTYIGEFSKFAELRQSAEPIKERKCHPKKLPLTAILSTAAESKEEREDRLERQRLSVTRCRAAESEEKRKDRLEKNRLAEARSRAAENEAQRKDRLERKRLSAARSRAAESKEEREDRLERKRLAAARSRAAENKAEREDGLERQRLTAARSRAEESKEEWEDRLERKRLSYVRSRAAESKEEREDRLERKRLAAARSRAAESKEEREDRLERKRLAAARSRAADRKAEWESRLEKMQLAAAMSRASMNEEPDKMRPNMDIPKIGTHDGTFHCDEVFACYLLKQLPKYENATIVRTRNSELLKTCDVVVDIGGEYDPGRHRYDHHQRTFDGTMKSLSPVPKPWETKLSSAGLVYLHFGHLVLARHLGVEKDDEIVEKLYDKMYENFVEEIDAIDNGVSPCPDKPNYSIMTNISARVEHLNPYWNDDIRHTEDRFHKAVALVGEEFKDLVDFYAKDWWSAWAMTKASISRRFQVDEGGQIMELSAAGCPWKDHLFTLEEEAKVLPTIKFVIFPDGAGNWRVEAVPISSNSFESRITLLYGWRGLRGEELSQKSGIPGGISVHVSGFIGGNKTREGALEMARVTLANHEEVMATMRRLWHDESPR